MNRPYCIRKDNYCKALFGYMGEGFIHSKIVYDEKGNPVDFIFIDMNKIFEDFIGISKENAISKAASLFIEDLDNNILKMLKGMSYDGKPKSIVYHNEKLKKYYKIIVFSVISGEFFAVFVDITDSIKSLEYKEIYNTLLDNSIDTILLIDNTGIIVYANSAAEKLYGYKKFDIIGMNIQNLRSEEARRNFNERFSKAEKDGIVFETTHQKGWY